MTDVAKITDFIADWFARFDRLDPVEAFLRDLHPQVNWEMPDADSRLNGHARVRAWYAGVLDTLQRPTEHHVSNIEIDPGQARFTVLFRARTQDGTQIEARVREHWRYDLQPDGRPLITSYSAQILEEADR